MKKLIMALALTASISLMATTEVYQFKSTIKYPTTQGSVKSGYYRAYVSTSMNGTLTIDTENSENNILEVQIKKSGEKFTMAVSDEILAVIYGKKLDKPAALFTASVSDDDKALTIACAGIGSTKTKTTGCGPCGETETCTRVTKLSGNLVGSYDCGCDNGHFYVIDDDCGLIDEGTSTSVAPIYGTWSITLKTVNGEKYR